MKLGRQGIVALCAAAALSACGNKLHTREAVERGVLKGVSQRGVNVEAMDVSVTKVDFHGSKAEAVVSFAPKGGKLSDGLTMRYTLEQQGNDWVIVGRSPMDMQQHTGGAANPGSTMPGSANPNADLLNQPGNPLPDKPLPPGHPPLDGKRP